MYIVDTALVGDGFPTSCRLLGYIRLSGLNVDDEMITERHIVQEFASLLPVCPR